MSLLTTPTSIPWCFITDILADYPTYYVHRPDRQDHHRPRGPLVRRALAEDGRGERSLARFRPQRPHQGMILHTLLLACLWEPAVCRVCKRLSCLPIQATFGAHMYLVCPWDFVLCWLFCGAFSLFLCPSWSTLRVCAAVIVLPLRSAVTCLHTVTIVSHCVYGVATTGALADEADRAPLHLRPLQEHAPGRYHTRTV
jgi:hypothetical protein